MKIDYIREFLVLAKICNYSKAAEELYTSQTSLFNHIKSLEDGFGVSLFERSGKKIVLSEYGQMFLPYARVIVNATECFEKDVSEKKIESARAIMVGTQYRIADLIRNFRSAYSNYMIYTADCLSIEESLYKDGCELVFIRNFKDPEERYHSVPYMKDNLVAVLYRSHPLAGRESLALEELSKQHFVMMSTSKKTEYDGIGLCRQAGFIPKVVMSVLTGTDAARLVNDELGISLLLKKTLSRETLDNIVMVDLMPNVECHVSLCWRKDIVLSEGARQLVEFVKQLGD